MTNRVEINGSGIGEVSDEMISQRARQFAAADGRDEINAADISEARSDLAGDASRSGEEDADLIAEEDRPGGGVPPMSSGTQAQRVEPEDEDSFAAEEVEEGIAEADLDTRVKSRHQT